MKSNTNKYNFLQLLVLGASVLFLGACSTTTKTTYFKDDGKTVDRVEEVSEISDANALGNYLKQSDEGNATDRSLDVTKFSLGYADIGLTWFSIGGNSTKAPASADGSEKTLKGMAEVKKAGKTTIQTEKVGVNSDVAAKTETVDKAQ